MKRSSLPSFNKSMIRPLTGSPGRSPGFLRDFDEATRAGKVSVEQRVSFSGYQFDLKTARLWSGKREVKLTPKASEVLRVLLTHAGQPVGKEELFASVWSGTVVSDDALTSCIQELRRALTDNAKQPRFIETRHRRGYRFIARLAKPATKINAASDGASGPSKVSRGAVSDFNLDALWSQPAIAVFPFTDLSDTPDRAHFADGITQDISTALSCWRRYPVIARNSTSLIKKKHGDTVAAARELGARYFLQGSVRRAGSTIRICVQLVDASSQTQIWARRYDRDVGNMFAMQDEIAVCIAQSIEPHLTRRELHRALRKHPQKFSTAGTTPSAPSHVSMERCRTSTLSLARMPPKPGVCSTRRSSLTQRRHMHTRYWRCLTSMTHWRTGQRIRRAP